MTNTSGWSFDASEGDGDEPPVWRIRRRQHHPGRWEVGQPAQPRPVGTDGHEIGVQEALGLVEAEQDAVAVRGPVRSVAGVDRVGRELAQAAAVRPDREDRMLVGGEEDGVNTIRRPSGDHWASSSPATRDGGWVTRTARRPSAPMIQMLTSSIPLSSMVPEPRVKAIHFASVRRRVGVIGARRWRAAGRAARGDGYGLGARADGHDLAEVGAALEGDPRAVGGPVGEVVARASGRGGELPLADAERSDGEERSQRAVRPEVATEDDRAVSTRRRRTRGLGEHGEHEGNRDHGDDRAVAR